jgi:pyruvate formate lyase activating enzyme
MTHLPELLDRLTAQGDLSVEEAGGAVRCLACAHRCLVRPGRRGICRVRFERDGVLRVPWGYVAGLQADPIEKKPFFHILPGATALTFGMLGCNFHCDFCQNWLSSQVLRDPAAGEGIHSIRRISPEQIVAAGRNAHSQVIASSYNEPLITSEWAATVFDHARAAGMKCVYVSNGYATPEALDYLRPRLDGIKIDLKSMRDQNYRRLGGVLRNVLDAICRARDLGLWVEIVTLVVPGFNDSSDELWEIGRFLAGLSPDIPWHVTAYHPDYRMTGPGPTPVRSLLRAAEIGREAGLRYVYAGNVPGQVGEYENTSCPVCGKLLIRRRAYMVSAYHLTPDGKCPQCAALVAGMWRQPPGGPNAALA